MTRIIVTASNLAKSGRDGGVYHIPTKDLKGKRLPLVIIEHCCKGFVAYARRHPSEMFKLTVIGNAHPSFFDYVPPNVSLPFEYMY